MLKCETGKCAGRGRGATLYAAPKEDCIISCCSQCKTICRVLQIKWRHFILLFLQNFAFGGGLAYW